MRPSAKTVLCQIVLMLGIASLLSGHAAFARSTPLFLGGQTPAPHVAPIAPMTSTPTIDGYAPCDAAAFSADPLYGLDEESGFTTSDDPTTNTSVPIHNGQKTAPNALPPTASCSQPLTAPKHP